MSESTEQARMPVRGIVYALLASVLFGLTMPLAKELIAKVEPVLLAGFLYLGSGFGLCLYRLFSRRMQLLQAQPSLKKSDWGFLAGAILAGGVNYR